MIFTTRDWGWYHLYCETGEGRNDQIHPGWRFLDYCSCYIPGKRICSL